MPSGKNLEPWAASILEQKLECLNRTQTSLNFGFLRSNFQRKVAEMPPALIENPGCSQSKSPQNDIK